MSAHLREERRALALTKRRIKTLTRLSVDALTQISCAWSDLDGAMECVGDNELREILDILERVQASAEAAVDEKLNRDEAVS